LFGADAGTVFALKEASSFYKPGNEDGNILLAQAEAVFLLPHRSNLFTTMKRFSPRLSFRLLKAFSVIAPTVVEETKNGLVRPLVLSPLLSLLICSPCRVSRLDLSPQNREIRK